MDINKTKAAWLALTFYPIEHDQELKQLRSKLPPYLEYVRKTFRNSFSIPFCERKTEAVCDDIIRTASSKVNLDLTIQIDSVLAQEPQNTLLKEHQALKQISIRSVKIII